MAVDFFENEVLKVRNRFAAVYQGRDVYNEAYRTGVILAIVGLALLERKISRNHEKEDIKKFIENRTGIMRALEYAEDGFQAIEKREAEEQAKANPPQKKAS
jgi:hypothetical protein